MFAKSVKPLYKTGSQTVRVGAEGGTRTPTSYLTRPSNVRVYQFRHFGLFGKVFKNPGFAAATSSAAAWKLSQLKRASASGRPASASVEA
jgi:hypothetical protein